MKIILSSLHAVAPDSFQMGFKMVPCVQHVKDLGAQWILVCSWWCQSITSYSWTVTSSWGAHSWTFFWGTYYINMKLFYIIDFILILEICFCPLQGPNYEVEMKGSINQMDRSAKISEYLNIVTIKCQIVDESVLNVLELLRTFGICKLTCNFPLLKCSLRIIDKGTPCPA